MTDYFSCFKDIEAGSPIDVFALIAAFNEDPNEKKVNLGAGAYQTDDSKPWVFPVVSKVEIQLANDKTLNHEYCPVAGIPALRTAAAKLLLGDNNAAIRENRVDAIQAIGGTGALRIGMDFLHSRLGYDTIYVSKPTWGNHKGIAKSLLYTNIKEYRYWNNEKKSIDFENLLEDLRNAPEKSVIVLQAEGHTPTGADPTQDQWKKIAAVIKEKRLFPFFDCAYQGFSSGDLDKDAWSVRYFVEQGFELLAAQSFSKNFGLYNERVGQLLFVVHKSEYLPKVRSHFELIVRETWANSPAHGGRIVSTVLNSPELFKEWKECVKTMADRILLMRQLLFDKLKAQGTPGTWDHIVQQTGMFSYTGLSATQSEHLINNYHIYLLRDGRINMCGVTTKNVDYVATAIHDAVTNVKA